MKGNFLGTLTALLAASCVTAFAPLITTTHRNRQLGSSALESAEIQSNLDLLYRAAETKLEDSDAVFEALSELEQQMRQAAKTDESIAVDMQQQLTGSWRLIFTTGTAKTQERQGGARINYFPLKAIQSFDTTTSPMRIENGIYVGDWTALKFLGTMTFDLRKRRLNFEFDTIQACNAFFNIPLKRGQAESLGVGSGFRIQCGQCGKGSTSLFQLDFGRCQDCHSAWRWRGSGLVETH